MDKMLNFRCDRTGAHRTCGRMVEINMPRGMLASFAKEGAVVLYAGIGVGIYRCVHEWPVWLSGFFGVAAMPEPFVSGDFYLIVDCGKIIGVLLYMALCYALDRSRTKSTLRLLPSVVLAVCGAIPLLSLLGIPIGEQIVVASFVGLGIGSGMLFCQWVDVCGLLAPIRVVQVLAVSYIARALLLPAITGMGPIAGSVLALVLAGSSFAQVRFCVGKSAATGLAECKVPSARDLAGLRGLFLWVPVFAFAYGMGVSSTHLAHAAIETGLGKIVPALLVLALSVKLGDRFDRGVLYAIALPLMTAGLISIEFLGAAPSVSQMLLSAAMASFRLLAFSEVCSFAYSKKTSAMFIGGCVRILSLTVNDTAVCLTRLNPSFWNYEIVTLVVIMAAIFVGTLVYLPRISNRREHHPLGFSGEEAKRRNLEEAAASAGLSQRETTVFQLMVEGKTTKDIGEELFISKGAVRAHTSRIYDKFGVHSREDFDALFRGSR